MPNHATNRDSGHKLAEQARKSESFTQQARLILDKLARSQLPLQHCPQCDHCQALTIPWLSNIGIQNDSPSRLGQRSTHDNIHIEDDSSNISFNDEDFSIVFPASAELPTTLPSGLATPDSHRPLDDDFIKIIEENQHKVDSRSVTTIRMDNQASIPGSPMKSMPPNMSAQADAAMHEAASRGQTAMLKILLGGGAAIDSQDNEGRTALFHAAYNGHVESVKTLLIAGANPSTADFTGTCVLLAAVTQGHEKVVEALVSVP